MFPDQWIAPSKVDVIGKQHQIALLHVQANATRCIRDDQRLHAQQTQHANRKPHFFRRVTFIRMHAALHNRYGNAIKCADDQPSAMLWNGLLCEMWNVCKGNGCRIRDMVGESAKPGSKNDSDSGCQRSATTDKGGRSSSSLK